MCIVTSYGDRSEGFGLFDDKTYSEESTGFEIIVPGLEPELKRLSMIEDRLIQLQDNQDQNTLILNKLYKKDVEGADYISSGWFVQVHDVLQTPYGISLGAVISVFYGVPNLCFRSNSFPFVGSAEKPIYLPKSSNVGFRAMAIYKIKQSGYYDFRIGSDDGSRLSYQIVDPDVVLDEKNIRRRWTTLIDLYSNVITQAEKWKNSGQTYFNRSDLVLLRFDYFQMAGSSAACIKVAYNPSQSGQSSRSDTNSKNYTDIDLNDLSCSNLWSSIPLMGLI
jgi:hypothetical protein